MPSKLELLGREFWRGYIDVDDQVERLVRKAEWENLSGWDDREMGGAE
jgi:hypothetical protein